MSDKHKQNNHIKPSIHKKTVSKTMLPVQVAEKPPSTSITKPIAPPIMPIAKPIAPPANVSEIKNNSKPPFFYAPTEKKNSSTEISEEELYVMFDKHQKYELTLFENVFKSCIRTIQLESKMNKLYCHFEIPVYTFTDPPGEININLCAEYIQKKLPVYIKSSFVSPNFLIISWFKEQR